MKNYIYIAILSLFCFGCQEVIDIELDDAPPRLVIDAYFNIFNNEETGAYLYTEGGVLLSLSAPYFDDEIPSVSNATVYITNLETNEVINFIESATLGRFIPENGASFQPDFDTNYELTVIYDNETYNSTVQYIPAVPIDKLEQGDGVLFEGNEIEVKIFYTDLSPRVDFYLFDLDFDLFLPSEDTFYQGQDFNFSYFYEDDDVMGSEIDIKILGIDQDYYNYFNLILEQDQDDGNPFQTAPALIRGNIVNTSNGDNFPFGFFRISEVYTKSITVVEQ